MTVDDFVIDRIDDVLDPMLDYFASSGGGGGGIRGIGVLGGKPVHGQDAAGTRTIAYVRGDN